MPRPAGLGGRRWAPQQVPLGPLKLDRSHALSRSLVHCVLFREAGENPNFASPQAPATWVNGPLSVLTPLGPSGQTQGGTDYIQIPGLQSLGSAPFTVALLTDYVLIDNPYNIVFEKTDGTNREIGLWVGSGVLSYFAIGGAGTGIGSNNIAVAAGVPQHIVMSWDTATARFYVNGAQGTPLSFGGGSTYSPSYNWQLGISDSQGGSPSNYSNLAFHAWSRQLSDQEIYALYASPFAMLQSRPRRYYVIPPASGGATAYAVSATISAGIVPSVGLNYTPAAQPGTGESLWNVDQSGSITPTIGTTTQVHIGDTADAAYIYAVDLSNLAIGDVATITVKAKVLSANPQQILFKETYGPSPPIEGVIQTPPIVSVYNTTMQILQSAGTARQFNWMLLRGGPGGAAPGSSGDIKGGVGPSTVGPLQVCPTNPRYMATPDGKALYLAGSHIWCDADQSISGTTLTFAEFLNWIVSYENCNYIRLWAVPMDAWPSGYTMQDSQMPLQRSSTPGAVDGGNKWDLTAYNQPMFDQWHADAQAALAKNVYVQVQLFQQEFFTQSNCPWWGQNNINGCNPPDLITLFTATTGATWTALTNYVQKWLDTLWDCPNVVWDLWNEPDGGAATLAWGEAMASFIRNYEQANKYYQHPIVFTASNGNNGAFSGDSALYTSSAQYVCPGWGDTQITGLFATSSYTGNNIQDAPNSKPSLLDTDHITIQYMSADYVLNSFCRGYAGHLFMEVLDGTSLNQYALPPFGTGYTGQRTGGVTSADQARHNLIRGAMWAARTASQMVNMTAMAPSDSTSATNNCLTDGSTQYVVYEPALTTAPAVTLPDGFTWSVEFVSANTRTVTQMPGIGGTTALALPIKVSSNGRYLVDQNNTPWLMMCANAQQLLQAASVADATTWIAHRTSQGFNANWCNFVVGQGVTGTNMATFDGLLPFNNNDLTQPNASYWARIDQMVAAAAASNMILIVVVIDYYLLQGNTWIASQPTSSWSTFGTFIGNRYKNSGNLIYMWGNDYGLSGIDFSLWNTWDPKYKALHNAIRAADPSKMQSGETSPPLITLDDTNWNGLIDFNWAYMYSPTYYAVLRGYSYSPTMPVVLGEGVYEGESNGIANGATATNLILRAQTYWSILSGAAGVNWGSHDDWTWTGPPLSNLNSTGAIEQSYAAAFFNSIAWWNLVPDVSVPCAPGTASGVGGAYPGSTTVTRNGFVTAGYGTLQVPTGVFGSPPINNAPIDFVAAALTSDGTLGIAYCPSATTLTVAMNKMAGTTTARWWDPTNNTYTAISGSPFANSGTQNLTTPGNNSAGNPDWVLLLQA